MTVRVLDLFCGCGGSSWGAHRAGAEIACGIDSWPVAIDVYNDNFPGAGVVQLITGDGDPSLISDRGPFDLVLASPECTNHTCARGARPRCENSRLTARHAMNYVRYYRPRWVVMENVVHMRNWSRYNELLELLENDLGYHVRRQVINAADHGAPQSRKRLFLICDRESLPDEIAPLSSSSLPASSILDSVSAWTSKPLYTPSRARNTLLRAERGMQALPPFEDFLIVYYGSDAAGGWQKLDRPLRTLTTLDRFGLVSYRDGIPVLRMLQVPELLRAMGFDSGFRLERGTRREKVHMLGNGVCPPVMESVVRTLTGIIKKNGIHAESMLHSNLSISWMTSTPGISERSSQN